MNQPVFNRLGTVTGRLSSSKPNLQNIGRATLVEAPLEVALFGMCRKDARDLARGLRRAGFDALARESFCPKWKLRVRWSLTDEPTPTRLRDGKRFWEVQVRGDLADRAICAAVAQARPLPSGGHRMSRRAWRRALTGLQRVLDNPEARAALEAAASLGGQPGGLARLFREALRGSP